MVDVVLAALARGVDFIDTARAYGSSEETIGRALGQWRGARPFLATKVLPADPAPNAPPGTGWQHPVAVEKAYPAGSIRRSLEKSLTALDVGCVDLLQLHQYWGHWKNDAWLEELAELRSDGLVRQIGVSVPDHRHEMALPLVNSGLIDSVQTIVNIFDPLAMDCLLPCCEAAGVNVIARCILDEGGLAGFLRMDTAFRREDWIYGYFDCLPREIYLRRVEALRRFVPEHAESLAELAIRFVLSIPGVSVALCSMHVPAHLETNVKALDAGPLPSEVMSELRHRDRWIRNFYQERRYAGIK